MVRRTQLIFHATKYKFYNSDTLPPLVLKIHMPDGMGFSHRSQICNFFSRTHLPLSASKLKISCKELPTVYMRLADFSIFYSSILGLSLSMLWVAYCYRSTARIINGTHIHHKINYFIKCGCSTVNFPRKGVGKNIVPLNINLKIYRSIFFCVVRYS